jgi:hypothetical protein
VPDIAQPAALKDGLKGGRVLQPPGFGRTGSTAGGHRRQFRRKRKIIFYQFENIFSFQFKIFYIFSVSSGRRGCQPAKSECNHS